MSVLSTSAILRGKVVLCGWYETGQCAMRLCIISNVCQILGVLSMSAFLDGTDDDISRGSVSRGSVLSVGILILDKVSGRRV